jgi:5-methylcytosine-specific restriction endonuclease McrA
MVVELLLFSGLAASAAGMIEFDHIIPHTHGGANSVKNVQLLCRKCNLVKSDRI